MLLFVSGGKLMIKQRERYARVSTELPPLVKSLLFLNCSFSFIEFLNCSLSVLEVSGKKEKMNILN